MNCLPTKNGNIKSTESSIIDFFCNYIAPKFNSIVTAGPMTSIVQQQSSGYWKHVMSKMAIYCPQGSGTLRQQLLK